MRLIKNARLHVDGCIKLHQKGPVLGPYLALVITSTTAEEDQNPYPVAATTITSASARTAIVVAVTAAEKDQNPYPVIATASSVSVISQSVAAAVITAACCS